MLALSDEINIPLPGKNQGDEDQRLQLGQGQLQPITTGQKDFFRVRARYWEILSVNGGPVAVSWNEEQSNAARNSKDCTVIKHSGVTHMVPQQTSNNACDQSQKSHDGLPSAPTKRRPVLPGTAKIDSVDVKSGTTEILLALSYMLSPMS